MLTSAFILIDVRQH